MNYTYELDQNRLKGCSMTRAFPYVIKDSTGKIVRYAKTEKGCENWIASQPKA